MGAITRSTFHRTATNLQPQGGGGNNQEHIQQDGHEPTATGGGGGQDNQEHIPQDGHEPAATGGKGGGAGFNGYSTATNLQPQGVRGGEAGFKGRMCQAVLARPYHPGMHRRAQYNGCLRSYVPPPNPQPLSRPVVCVPVVMCACGDVCLWRCVPVVHPILPAVPCALWRCVPPTNHPPLLCPVEVRASNQPIPPVVPCALACGPVPCALWACGLTC